MMLQGFVIIVSSHIVIEDIVLNVFQWTWVELGCVAFTVKRILKHMISVTKHHMIEAERCRENFLSLLNYITFCWIREWNYTFEKDVGAVCACWWGGDGREPFRILSRGTLGSYKGSSFAWSHVRCIACSKRTHTKFKQSLLCLNHDFILGHIGAFDLPSFF